MTNREYLNTLNNEDFTSQICNNVFKFLEDELLYNANLNLFEQEENAKIDFLSWLEAEYKE